MKIYLDDERQTPPGWTRCFWPYQVIYLMETQEVEEISLDHDLGNDEKGTGYDVLLWIEEEVHMNGFIPPLIRVHSANPSARDKMEKAIKAIYKKSKEMAS